MKTTSIFSVQWFNSIIEKINELEQDWKNNIVQFSQSLLMEEHEVTTLLQISKSTLRRYQIKKYFRVYQIGKRNLYLQHDIIRGILTDLVK